MKTVLSEIKREDLEKIIKNSYTYLEVLHKLGYHSQNGGSYRTLKNKINKWNIDISHFKRQYFNRQKATAKDLFVENCQYCRQSVKRFILKHNLIPYQCAICGNTGKWNDKPLTLTLDHKNGVSNDNRLENLQFVCPNCDSQQDTYGSKNTKYKQKVLKNNEIQGIIKTAIDIKPQKIIYNKKNKNNGFCNNCGSCISTMSKGLCAKCYREMQKQNIPPKEILIEELKTFTTFTEFGKRFNVSGNAIKKWFKKYDIPHLKKELQYLINNI